MPGGQRKGIRGDEEIMSRFPGFLTKNPSLKIGGGFFSINAPQILALPFKQPSENVLNSVNRAFDRVVAAKRGDVSADTTTWEREINRHVYALYGLTKEEIALVEGTQAK